MNNYTQRQLRPLGMWEYFLYTILFTVPLVGFICLIVLSFNDSNINRRNFARSYFCTFIIAVILIVVLALSGIGALIVARLSEVVASMAVLF